MKRKIIKIDSDKCNGCGLCADACHEGAIGMSDGKAVLLRDDYCDGLGDCLPVCPTGAITFEEREAAAYDEAAVKVNMEKRKQNAAGLGNGCKTGESNGSGHHAGGHHAGGHHAGGKLPCGCPGSNSKAIARKEEPQTEKANHSAPLSRLSQWPVQIKLVPVNAPYFNGANLLIAADCSAFAYGDFHNKFIKNHITLVGCPKLDFVEYAEKLTEIIKNNDIKSIKIVRMEVPCCGGIESAAKTAIKNSGKFLPWQVYTITTDGNLVE